VNFTRLLRAIHTFFTGLHYDRDISRPTRRMMPGASLNFLKEMTMNRNLVIGIAGGALAVVLAGGAVLAGPSIAARSGAAASTTGAQSG